MTTNRTLRVLVLATLLVALAGCGGGSSDGGNAAASDGGGGEDTAVTIADLEYSPAEVSVAAGGSVTWTNDDTAPHTVTFDDDALAGSDQMETGDDFTATFDSAGSYSYVCALHPDMTGTVTVQ